MLAPGDCLIVPVTEDSNRRSPAPTPSEGLWQTREPLRPELTDDCPRTFLEALRRMLASIHS